MMNRIIFYIKKLGNTKKDLRIFSYGRGAHGPFR